VAVGSRFRVTPAAAPEQPEIKQLQNALLVPPPLNEWVSLTPPSSKMGSILVSRA
jgi:hypothetical protein